MAGQVYRVLKRNTYSVTSTQLPAAQAFTFPVAVNVDASWAVYGSLLLRAHAFSVGSGTGTGPTIRAIAYPSAPTEQDPNTLYRSGATLISSGSITGAATFTPTLAIGHNATPGNLGEFIDILIEITQWTTTAGNLSIVASTDLVLKA